MAPAGRKKKKADASASPEYPPINFPAIRNRITEFKLEVAGDNGYVLDANDKNYVDLKCYGVVLHNEAHDEKKFCCLASSQCMQNKTTVALGHVKNPKKKWISSNATRHLSEEHGIVTKKAQKMEEKALSEGQERHEMKHAFRRNMDRLCELQWVKMIILCRMPFLSATLQVVRDTWHYTCIEEMTKNLSRPRVLHLCTEIYSQVLGGIKQMMVDSSVAFGKRIFSINLDNWKPKNSIRRFTGMRIYFLDTSFKLQTFLLGMREFKPSFNMRDGMFGLRTSMKVWALGLLASYGLDFSHIFSATTDGASDVRILTQQDMGALWEWCPPHMLNRILFYAFGLKRNSEMKREVDAMRAVITKIRDSTKYGSLWQENLDKANPEMAAKVLKSHQDQRFMGIYLTILRFYEMYESIMATCQDANIPNNVTLTKAELVQLLSMLQPLRELSVSSQEQKTSYGYRVLSKLCHERTNGVLNMLMPVTVYNHKTNIIPTWSLRVAHTRRMMIQATDLKFFKRYFQMSRKTKSGEVVKQGYLMEAQHLLHPALRHLNPVWGVIEELVNSESVACSKWWGPVRRQSKKMTHGAREYEHGKKQEYMRNVRKLITAAVEKNIIGTIIESSPEENMEPRTSEQENRQPRNTLDMTSMEQFIRQERSDEPQQESTSYQQEQGMYYRVTSELEKYLQATSSDKAFSDINVVCNIQKWMASVGQHNFKLVVRAMFSYFGVPSSSAGIELDFCFSSLILRKQRMSMSSEVIEMVHMLDRNRSLIDLAQVDRLTIAGAAKAKPVFNGDDFLPDVPPEEDLDNESESDETGDATYDDEDDSQRQQRMPKQRQEMPQPPTDAGRARMARTGTMNETPQQAAEQKAKNKKLAEEEAKQRQVNQEKEWEEEEEARRKVQDYEEKMEFSRAQRRKAEETLRQEDELNLQREAGVVPDDGEEGKEEMASEQEDMQEFHTISRERVENRQEVRESDRVQERNEDRRGAIAEEQKRKRQELIKERRQKLAEEMQTIGNRIDIPCRTTDLNDDEQSAAVNEELDKSEQEIQDFFSSIQKNDDRVINNMNNLSMSHSQSSNDSL